MRFSIVITTYNKVGILKCVLMNLHRQSLQKNLFEVIVINDGSTDSTPELLASFKPDYPFRYVTQSQQGISAARNVGASLARHPYLLFMDDDIIYVPEYLEILNHTCSIYPNHVVLGNLYNIDVKHASNVITRLVAGTIDFGSLHHLCNYQGMYDLARVLYKGEAGKKR